LLEFIPFFPREISELHRPIGAKFCTMLGAAFNFIITVQNFVAASPKKILETKNMQNLARFRSTSKLGNECLRKGWRYSKSVSYSFDSNSSRVWRNKPGEVWSSNLGDLHVELYPPKAHFSEDHISASRGCCTTKFLHALENDQVLLAHPPPRTVAPLTIFFQREVKNGLKT